MEEKSIEIIDYLKIIWKRKILIIVGVLVGMVAGVVMNLRVQELYRAETLLKIGKKVVLLTTSTSSASLIPSFSLVRFDSPKTLIKTIPVEYGLNGKESGKGSLSVELVSDTELLRIIVEGVTRRKAEESLNKVVKRLIDDHSRMIDDSLLPLRDIIEKQKASQKVVIDEVASSERRLKEIENEDIDNPSMIVTDNILWEKQSSLRDIKNRLMIYQLIVDNAGKYKSKIIGSVNITTIPSNKRSNVIKAGTLGLVISLFLAFFIEYIGRIKKM